MIIVYVVNTSGRQLVLVCTVAVPCIYFLVAVVARAVVWFVLFSATSL